MAVECPARQGLHIFEDCFIVQVVDPETGEQLPDGEVGSLVVTELYKTGSPQFRYNIMDLASLMPKGERCECGSWLRRMGPFAGRGAGWCRLPLSGCARVAPRRLTFRPFRTTMPYSAWWVSDAVAAGRQARAINTRFSTSDSQHPLGFERDPCVARR